MGEDDPVAAKAAPKTKVFGPGIAWGYRGVQAWKD
jgi:hypothetical protein